MTKLIIEKSRPVSLTLILLFLLVFPVVWTSCISNEPVQEEPGETAPPEPVDEDELMNRVFRIDILSMDIALEYVPDQNIIKGESEIRFRMRPGQTLPLIHFDPVANDAVEEIILDGENLDIRNPADVRIISFEETTQDAIEFQRECGNDKTHSLRIRFVKSHVDPYQSFYSNVNDIHGVGNEAVFPTINCPSELSRHRIDFSVVSDIPYSFIGSGKVAASPENGLQKWTLDTERDIASYTLMWMLVPSDDVDLEERVINGIPVRMMAYKDSVSIETGFAILETWLPELESNIGAFPMKNGLDVFLTLRGGGMEYFGGTITSLEALEHEVFHMYYGCSVIAKTYRDSWWDEAIDMWYEYSAKGTSVPINPSYSSDIVSGRTPVSVGFDDRAYNDGAKIIEAIAVEMGGRQAFVDFLRHVYENYVFSPFNTMELSDLLLDYSGIDFKERILKWLYKGVQTYFSDPAAGARCRRVDMTPPDWILRKYRK